MTDISGFQVNDPSFQLRGIATGLLNALLLEVCSQNY